MAEYVSFEPGVEVWGQSAQGVLIALGEDAIPILEKYGLHPIDPNGWYNQQNFLNAYREIAKSNFLNLVAVGMQVPDLAGLPPEIQTIDDALNALNVAYQMHHRGGKIGEYAYERTGERAAKMVARNPYPSDFDYGIIYRMVQKFRPSDSDHIIVELDPQAPTRKNGADSCTYLIEW
ncbi:MAG: hypothetical protein AAFV33_09140 [Chloroflexota bacterium]